MFIKYVMLTWEIFLLLSFGGVIGIVCLYQGKKKQKKLHRSIGITVLLVASAFGMAYLVGYFEAEPWLYKKAIALPPE